METAIPKRAAGQDVFEAIHDYLQQLRATVTEPTRIREETLAQQLGVSRTPVREALIRLQGSGMVQLRPGRGALLMPVTQRDYLEWLQIREPLEALAAREAALNASQHDVDRLRALFLPFLPQAHPAKDADTVDAYNAANVAFHEALMRLSGNQLLLRMWQAFGHLQTSHRRNTIARLQRRHESLREHLAIIDAIEQRNAPLAETLARNHVHALYLAVHQVPAF